MGTSVPGKLVYGKGVLGSGGAAGAAPGTPEYDGQIGIDEPGTPDAYLNSWQRTIGGTALEEQTQLEAVPDIRTFWVDWYWYNTSVNNDTQIFQIMGDGLNYVRVNAIGWNRGDESFVSASNEYAVIRATSPGTGGTAILAHSLEQGDGFGGDLRIFDSDDQFYPPQTDAAGEGGTVRKWWHLGERWNVLEPPDYPGAKGWIIGPSEDDGLVIRQIQELGTMTGHLFVHFTVTPYL